MVAVPFFGTLCVPLKLVAGPVPTMATDGRRIVYNPKYIEELKPAELEGVLAHEVLHCALAHHCRRGQRNPELWNEAADYAVNPIPLATGIVLPPGVLARPAFANLSAEEIYARLMKTQKSSELDSNDKSTAGEQQESQPCRPGGSAELSMPSVKRVSVRLKPSGNARSRNGASRRSRRPGV